MASSIPAGLRGLCIRLAGIVLLAAMGAAGQETVDEYQLKGGFIYNILKFVEWPAGAFAGPENSLVVCILGESPIAAVLETAARDRLIYGRKVAIRLVSDARRIEGCNFVFVSFSGQRAWRSAPNNGPLSGILTVGEGDTLEGVIVNLKRDGDRIGIQIDLEAARRGKLQISSKLLSLSEIVKR